MNPFPDPAKAPTWWNGWWARALGSEPSLPDPASLAKGRAIRFAGRGRKPLALDLSWGKVGLPAPTWPPEFEPLWPDFLEFLNRPGLPTPLDPTSTWVVASPSSDRTKGLCPILVALPLDQVPFPGSVIVARRPQDHQATRTLTVSPLGGFRLPVDEARKAAPGAVAMGCAWIGEVWKV